MLYPTNSNFCFEIPKDKTKARARSPSVNPPGFTMKSNSEFV